VVALFFNEYSIDANVTRIVEYVSTAHDSNTLGLPPQDGLFSAKIMALRIDWPYNFAVEMDDNFQLCAASTTDEYSRRACSFLAFSQFRTPPGYDSISLQLSNHLTGPNALSL
jgi:hypothetical protein